VSVTVCDSICMSASVYYYKYFSGDQIEKNKMDGTNGTYGGQ